MDQNAFWMMAVTWEWKIYMGQNRRKLFAAFDQKQCQKLMFLYDFHFTPLGFVFKISKSVIYPGL